MKSFILIFLISMYEVSNVIGQLPHEIEIDSQDILKLLRRDASDYCDVKCHANPKDCQRDPNGDSLSRCADTLNWVNRYNYQVCAEDCRERCNGSLDDCDCRNFCAQRASTVIRKTSRSPKELVEIFNEYRRNPNQSKFRSSRTGRYTYIGQ